ncbi:MAG: hypothetical protein FJ119_13520 [Deltaproteobacteria bacterium]|nr:hypothetical protein [Deltaproteobacteria bacterium]
MRISGLLICLFLLLPVCAKADIAVVAVERTVTVAAAATQQTRDAAIKQAVREAFGEVLKDAVQSLPQQPTTSQQGEFRKAMYAKMDSFVSESKVVSSKNVDGNQTELRVRTEVNKGLMMQELQRLMQAKRNPRVLFMVAEKCAAGSELTYWWGGGGKSSSLGIAENELFKIFNDKGFTCVDALGVARRAKVSDARRTALLDDSAALLFGQAGGAELVVVGKASADSLGALTGSQLRSIKADLSLRVLRIDTGETIASASGNSTAIDISPQAGSAKAFRGAAAEISDNIISQIMSEWQKNIDRVTVVEIDVSPITYVQLIELKNILTNSGCTRVTERRFENDRAQLSVELAGDAQHLANKIALQHTPHLPVKVTGVSQNMIKLAVKGQGI